MRPQWILKFDRGQSRKTEMECFGDPLQRRKTYGIENFLVSIENRIKVLKMCPCRRSMFISFVKQL